LIGAGIGDLGDLANAARAQVEHRANPPDAARPGRRRRRVRVAPPLPSSKEVARR
jgi:hypothetical protein